MAFDGIDNDVVIIGYCLKCEWEKNVERKGAGRHGSGDAFEEIHVSPMKLRVRLCGRRVDSSNVFPNESFQKAIKSLRKLNIWCTATKYIVIIDVATPG